MSFKRQNAVTSSNAITDVTFDHFSVVNDVNAARPFRTVTLLFHITQFFNIGCIGEVCSNMQYTYIHVYAQWKFFNKHMLNKMTSNDLLMVL